MSPPSPNSGLDNQALEGPEITERELENKCWKYTWMGPVNDNTNRSTSCDNSPENENTPCFEPIVWTNGTNKFNQPDLADLNEKCKQGQTIQHKVKILVMSRIIKVCLEKG